MAATTTSVRLKYSVLLRQMLKTFEAKHAAMIRKNPTAGGTPKRTRGGAGAVTTTEAAAAVAKAAETALQERSVRAQEESVKIQREALELTKRLVSTSWWQRCWFVANSC